MHANCALARNFRAICFLSTLPINLGPSIGQKATSNIYGGETPDKAPPVENFAWLPVGVNSNTTGRGSVSLI